MAINSLIHMPCRCLPVLEAQWIRINTTSLTKSCKIRLQLILINLCRTIKATSNSNRLLSI